MHRGLRRLLILGFTASVALTLWKRFVQGPHASTPGAPVTYSGTPASTTPAPAVAADPRPADTSSTSPRTTRAAVDVSALIEAPAAFAAVSSGPARWVAPIDGACPEGYPIKANDKSGIFHVPGGRFYERTIPERCYADADAAAADGYRRAKA